ALLALRRRPDQCRSRHDRHGYDDRRDQDVFQSAGECLPAHHRHGGLRELHGGRALCRQPGGTSNRNCRSRARPSTDGRARPLGPAFLPIQDTAAFAFCPTATPTPTVTPTPTATPTPTPTVRRGTPTRTPTPRPFHTPRPPPPVPGQVRIVAGFFGSSFQPSS